jgi:hypothetical protein
MEGIGEIIWRMKGAMKDPRFVRNVLIKALVLFIAANVLFAFTNPLPALGRLSAYNGLFPGRLRLPYGDRPDLAYNLSLFNLDAMFASHEIASGRKPADEFRVVLIGDSSTWGFLLRPEDTLSALLNARGLVTPSGKQVRVFNLGYPTMSLTKDLLMLSRALRYQPDLILWLVTLESFPASKQLASPIVQHNPQEVRELIAGSNLRLDADSPEFVTLSRWDQTLIGQRRAIADWFRLQLYGVLWSATGVDQVYPEKYAPPQRNLTAEEVFYGLEPPLLNESDLAFDALEAGVKLAGDVPVMFVNEPIYLSDGQNSDIRYNFYYPRWIYDQYRQAMHLRAEANGWLYLDVWNLVPAGEFTNSAIHLTPVGENQLAEQISRMILPLINER